MGASSNLEVVIAHYNEPLAAFEPCGARATIYTKSPATKNLDAPPDATVIRLPNHGRDCHTHLHHIVTNYDRLADITLFTQADPFDHLDSGMTVEDMLTRSSAAEPNEVVCWRLRPINYWDGFPWNEHEYMRSWLKANPNLKREDYTLGEMWKYVTGGEKLPKRVFAIQGAIFAARRETLRKVPLETWERCLGLFERDKALNPEVGCFMEYLFGALLSSAFRVYE